MTWDDLIMTMTPTLVLVRIGGMHRRTGPLAGWNLAVTPGWKWHTVGKSGKWGWDYW